MRTTHLLLATCLFFAPLASSAHAQRVTPVDNEAEFTLVRYVPDYVHADSLYETLDSMYGRKLQFEDRSVNNLAILEDSVVIYETEERSKRILNAIEQLDVTAQHEEEEDTNTLLAKDVVLKNYLPKYLDNEDLYEIAVDLYGDRINIGGDWYSNLRLTNTGILVYDEASAANKLLAQLVYLDESQAPPTSSAYAVLEYQPRHVSASGLMEGIRPFMAGISSTPGGRQSNSMNVSLMSERGTIIIRDLPQRAEEILATLKRLDQPAPQIMVVCQVIRGVNIKTENPVADDLQKQLRQLLAHESYAVVANGMLRGSTTSNTTMELKMTASGESGVEFNFKMRVGAFDPETGALDMESCELNMFDPSSGNHDLFRTATTVYSGEYAVLGVTGAEPLFLVVQLHAVQGQR